MDGGTSRYVYEDRTGEVVREVDRMAEKQSIE